MNREFIRVTELPKLGNKLREWRRNAGITLQDLSKESGVPLNTIARIERGEMDTRVSTAYKLWHALCDLTLPY